jgi:DNA-binding NarL/FixJ family response regulator
MTSRRRVIVADDNALVREGLVQLLTRSGFDVLGQAGDGDQVISLIRELAPDLVVVDTRMPPTWKAEGLETARQIREQFPSVGILLLSASVEIDHALQLLTGGDRVGYLLKSQIAEVGQLADALEQISLGGSVIDPSLVTELMTTYRSEDPLTQLTSAELDVLAQIAQGRSDTGTAQRLGITEEEVRHHVQSIFAKLRLPESGTDYHRVLALLAYLEAR